MASEQASIALTVDVSGSMSADDVKPTRLGAAQEAIRRFLDRASRAKYRVGLITFSSEPYVAAPLTHDRQLVLDGCCSAIRASARAPRSATHSPARSSCSSPSSTGGDAVGAAGSATLAPPPDPNRPLSAILLLSDGAQTRGNLAPLAGAARAKSYGIPVYTVALGTPDGVLNRGGFSRPVPPDPVTLRQIAQATGGEFFATQSKTRLNAVYEDLASRLGHKNEWRELSYALVGLAALLALAAGALSLVWNQRLP